MTAAGIPALLEPIQNRWASATPGPWEADGVDIVQTEKNWSTVLENNVSCMSYCYGGSVQQEIKPADKAAILAAPVDVARLLAAVQAGTSILDERARELRKTADRLNQQVIDRDPDRDIEAAQRYSHYAAQAEAAAYAHRAAVVAALGGEA